VKLRRQQAEGKAGPGAATGRSGSLGAWRQRRALPLLVALPAVALSVVAASQIISSAHDMAAFQRVHSLAETGESVAGLAQALEVERNDTSTFVVLGPLNGGRGAPRSLVTYQLEERVLHRTYRATDERAEQVMRQVSAIGSAYPAPVRAQARAEMAAIRGLPGLRDAATATELNGLSVIGEYTTVIQDVLGFNQDIALPGDDAGLAQAVRVLGLVSQLKEEESDQAAILTSGLSSDLVNQGSFGPDRLAAITGSMAAQKADAQVFDAEATPAQVRQYNSVLSGLPVERATTEEAAAVAIASSPGASAGPTTANASTGLSYQVSGLRALEMKLSSSVAGQAASRRGAAQASVAIAGALLLALILLVAFIFLFPALRRRHGSPAIP
jgi:hypothetical protein